MGGQLHGSSSDAQRGQVKQQVHSDYSYYSAMGSISGGIMRFNISDYDPALDVERVGVRAKRDSHRVPWKKHSGQIGPDVKGDSKSSINS